MRLHLLRHAKAAARRPDGDDRERVLDPRGREEAGRVAAHLRRDRIVPDLALVSPAARTRETWSLTGLAGRVPVRFVEAIYEAEIGDLLDVIRAVEAGIGGLLLVGHNPGLEDLACLLAPGEERLASGLPTGAFVSFELAAGSWQEFGPGGGRLAGFAVPADLPAAG